MCSITSHSHCHLTQISTTEYLFRRWQRAGPHELVHICARISRVQKTVSLRLDIHCVKIGLDLQSYKQFGLNNHSMLMSTRKTTGSN